MKVILKRIVCLLLSLLILLPMTVFASPPSVALSLSARLWSGNGNIASLSPGDTIAVDLSVQGSMKLSGISMSLSYNPDIFQFYASSSYSSIIDQAGVLSFYDNKSGKINVLWDTSSVSTSASGTLLTVCFVVKSNAVSGTYPFSAQIKELYLSTDGSIPSSLNPDSVSVTVGLDTIIQNNISTFTKLQNITYPGSFADITAADILYNSLTYDQKLAFVNNYADIYTTYAAAWTTYYKLAEQASQAQINAEINAFLSSYDDVLTLTTETVQIKNSDRVDAAISALNSMASAAKQRVSKSTTNLLKALKKKIDQLTEDEEKKIEIRSEAEQYIENNKILWDLTDSIIETQYVDLIPVADLAVVDYEHLSQEAKELVAVQHEKLLHITDMLNKLTANDEELAKIREEVGDFQKKWRAIISLNIKTVGAVDETAIKQALLDFHSLSASAQEMAAPRKVQMEALLQKINDLKSEPNDEGGGITVITVPGETKTITNTVIKEVPKTVKETVVKTVNKLYDNGISKALVCLFILLGISLTMSIISEIAWKMITKRGIRYDAH